MPARILIAVLMAIALAAVACDDEGGEEPPVTSQNAPSNVIAFGGETPDGHGLYIVRPDGVRPDGTALTLLQSEPEAVSSPAWSPEGGRIAYLTGAGPALTLRVYDFDRNGSVTASESALEAESGRAASWSPDGRRIAHTESGEEGGRIAVFDVSLGERPGFPDVPGFEPDWSPDGGELAFARPGEGGGIFVMEAAGGEPELLLEGASLRSPRWSPDGERIVVTEGATGEETLLLVERSDGAVTELGAGQLATWSPDGARLVYSAPPVEGAGLDVFFIDVPDGAPQPVSEAVTRNAWATWSPDGGGVALLSEADARTAFICVVRLDARERDCLNLPDVLPATPAWSPR